MWTQVHVYTIVVFQETHAHAIDDFVFLCLYCPSISAFHFSFPFQPSVSAFRFHLPPALPCLFTKVSNESSQSQKTLPVLCMNTGLSSKREMLFLLSKDAYGTKYTGSGIRM